MKEALLGECSSGGTRGSHPGIKFSDLPPGVRPYPTVLGD